ncbi:alpha/beta fold hydrolase [Nocardioides sp.]|uniref:alpha/beta fold hydrolase n=1 Tax=Nocardioides sp. TaxID=35761 RepID=UPI00271FFB3E|nr:alpha/beta fold hydrolase [Nocardioides sp.]MDO9456029.1 alpha/beta fold hydrolase [Nocardioides sp.]
MSIPGGAPVGAAWPGVVDTHLEVGGRSLRVLHAPGRRGAGPGEPQLLVHGLGGSAVTWVEVIDGLAAHGPVVALDLPGFGGTPVVEGDQLSVEAYADVVVAVADTLGWSSFALHGNSMGGLVATLVAADHPDRVARLVLVSPALPPSFPLRLLVPSRATITGMAPIAVSAGSAAAFGLLGGVPEALDRRRKRALLGLIFGSPDEVDPDLLDLMAREFGETREGADPGDQRRALRSSLASITRTWLDPRRVWRAIDAIQAPTMILGGTADALVPARVLRQVLARRTDWQGHVLGERRHALMMESPADYLDLVDRWYADRVAA